MQKDEYISIDSILDDIQETYGFLMSSRDDDHYVLHNSKIIIRIDLWDGMHLPHYFRMDSKKDFDRWANARFSFYFGENLQGLNTIKETIYNFTKSLLSNKLYE